MTAEIPLSAPSPASSCCLLALRKARTSPRTRPPTSPGSRPRPPTPLPRRTPHAPTAPTHTTCAYTVSIRGFPAQKANLDPVPTLELRASAWYCQAPSRNRPALSRHPSLPLHQPLLHLPTPFTREATPGGHPPFTHALHARTYICPTTGGHPQTTCLHEKQNRKTQKKGKKRKKNHKSPAQLVATHHHPPPLPHTTPIPQSLSLPPTTQSPPPQQPRACVPGFPPAETFITACRIRAWYRAATGMK